MQSYSSPYTGAFGLNTGDKVWDQNLSSLGGLLFPDQSKVAQAYHYGSEARKAQLQSNTIIDQQNNRNRYNMMTSGGPQPALPTFYDPGNVPGAAPITDAPANLPYTGAAPTAPAPTGLGAVIANTVADKTPGQMAETIKTVIPQFTTGRAKEFGAPAPGLPVAPQTTGSDGSTNANDQTSGPLGAASINTTGGGQQQAPPAAHNGSPARMPPGMTLPGLLAMHGAGALAGLDAATLAGGGQALAYELFSRGIIAENQYKQMLGGTGATQPMVADIGAAATVRGHEITAGATLEAARVRERGETARKGMEQQIVVTDPITGAATLKPLSTMQGLGGTPTFSQDAVKAGVTPITVQPGGPGTASYSTPTGRAQQPQPGAPGQPQQPGMPLYDAQLENTRQTQLGAVKNFIDPKQPTVLIPATVEEARQNGWVAMPESLDQWNTLAAYASANAPPEQAQQIREKVLAFATSTTPKPTNANESRHQQMLLDQQLQIQMPVPTGGESIIPGSPYRTNQSPAGSSPNLEIALADLRDQYFRYDPATKGDPITSANKAIQQLIEEKYVDPNQSRSKGLITDETTISKGILKEDGTVAQVPHFRVDLLDPKTGKPYAEGQVPRIAMRKSLGATVTPGPTGPAPRGPAPLVTGARPAGAAPAATAAPAGRPAPGLPEGHTGTGSDGSRWIVRGGSWVPQ